MSRLPRPRPPRSASSFSSSLISSPTMSAPVASTSPSTSSSDAHSRPSRRGSAGARISSIVVGQDEMAWIMCLRPPRCAGDLISPSAREELHEPSRACTCARGSVVRAELGGPTVSDRASSAFLDERPSSAHGVGGRPEQQRSRRRAPGRTRRCPCPRASPSICWRRSSRRARWS